ncbi:non-homologous end-joining DNA ligase [Jatrophihabitans sp.]|uniref:non-homologous end-joining DNA ligase n=1 Tax=Jatrophihabitans sp. TaxID=1932789 RepID=UPI002F228127
MSPEADDQLVSIDGHQFKLKRLDKVLYPEAGTTKAEVLDYYARIAPVLLSQLADRPVTRIRWPDGTDSTPFFEKNVPSYAPSWLRTVKLPTPGSSRNRETLVFPVLRGTADLIWMANLAALELHVPQWTVGPRGAVRNPNRLVIDLDPGPPAGLAECAEAAHLIRDRLAEDGLTAIPVTSGSKGLQLYAPLDGSQSADLVIGYAKRLAETLARSHPKLVVSNMTKALRVGKVLLDWSQNNPSKTTICPYSLRGRARPWVAAPRTWEELAAPGLSQLDSAEVLRRVQAEGDLAAGLLQGSATLPV